MNHEVVLRMDEWSVKGAAMFGGTGPGSVATMLARVIPGGIIVSWVA